MDLGFGAFLEKFEEHFGKRVTKWLIVLIGLALVAACVGMIWTWLLAPLLAFFQSPVWQKTLAGVAIAALGIGAGVTVGLSLVAAFNSWRQSRKFNKAVSEINETVDRARAGLKDVELRQAHAKVLLEATILIAEAGLEQDETLEEEDRANRLRNLELARTVLKDPDQMSEEERVVASENLELAQKLIAASAAQREAGEGKRNKSATRGTVKRNGRRRGA